MKLSKIVILIAIFFNNSFCEDFNYRFNYFGNLNLSALNEEGYAFRNFQMEYIKDDIDYQPYSKLGSQLNINKNNFDLTAQAIVKRYESSFDTDLPWLNLKYTYNDFAIRAGKMQLPLFLNSNTLDIDYIHLWAKAPIEVYGIFPAKTYKGLEFIYQKSFSDSIYLDLQATPYGEIKEKVSMLDTLGKVTAKVDNIRNIMLNLEIDNLIFRTSYTKGKLTIPLDGTGLNTLTNTLNALGFNDLAKKYSFKDNELEFLSFGLDYTYDNLIFNSEISKIDSNSFLPSMLAYYALTGYRYNKWTPFLMYARNKNDKDHYTEGALSTTSTSPVIVGTIKQLKDSLEKELYKMNSSQETISLGLKYDYKPGIAFKFQFDRITTTNYGTPHTDSAYERFGFLSRKRGVEDKPVYLYTLSFGFAF